jgi:hypothetical protein
VAAARWCLCVTTRRERTEVTVRGPETKATVVPIPEDAEFFGIDFTLGTFMPEWPLAGLVDRAATLPTATRRSVWLADSRWEIPTPANVDVFVDRLARAGLLAHDAIAAESLQDGADRVPTRTRQRRVARATGLTRRTIRQIARADQAVALLEQGVTPVATTSQLGYADQSHLTRSLQRFIGQTPTRIAAGPDA